MATDSFDSDARVPTDIGEVVIRLYVSQDSEGAYHYRDFYHFPVLDADGDIIEHREGALRAHLTAQEISQVAAFLNARHTQALGVIP
jgi:hypothetical protein